VASVFLLLLAACDHSPLGFDQLERGIQEPSLAVPLRPDRGASYGKFNANNSSGSLENLVLGRNYAYESRVLLRFALTDSAPSLDSVDSVRIVLHTRTFRPVPFTIYRITTEWDDFQTTWHDAKTGEPWYDPGGDFDTLQPIAEATIEKDSTLIPLSRASLDSLMHNGYGLILIPGTADSGTFVTLFARSATAKKPRVTYFYGTNRREFDATQNTYIVDTVGLNLQPGRFWLGSGYIFRSYFHFNLDSLRDTLDSLLLPDPTATVITAALRFSPESTFTFRETVALGAHRLTSPYEPSRENATFEAAAFGRGIFVVHKDTSDPSITLDVRPLVQYWIQKPDSNFGLLLTLEPQDFDVSRMELRHGAFLPTLRIGFVKPPFGRF
jgi:hypothetical protein